MPAAAPIIATAAFSGFSATAFAGFSWLAFGGSLVLGGLSYALTPKPKAPAQQSLGGGTVAVRQSDLTRQHVYGHTRVTRGYAHMWSTGVNGRLHQMVILCEGELRAINEIWVNDYCIPPDWIDDEGNVTQGRYAGKLVIRKHLGSPSQVADSLAVSNLAEWTPAHRLRGIAYLYLIMDKDQDVYPNGVPNITAIVEGPSLYDPRQSDDIWSTNIAVYSRDFLTNARYGFAADVNDLDDQNISAQANICDEIVEVTYKQYEVTNVSAGTSIFTLSGDLNDLCFGDRVEISGSDLPSPLEEDTEYYVIPYQVKDTPRIMLAASLEDAMAKNFIALSDSGSGEIAITKTGEPRYHGSGIIDTENSLSRTLNEIVTSMAGRAVCVGGFWSLFAGAWRTPSINLGIGDMRGNGFGYKTALPMAEAYNVVKGLFISPVSLYQSTDYPTARYQTFIDEDNGIEEPKELNLPFTDRPTTAQRIAKIELFRSRQGIVCTSDFSTKALALQPCDNTALTIPSMGWEDKPFEITTFALNIDNNAMSCRLEMRETAQEIFDWSAGEAIAFDPAPNTALPNPFNVLVPTGVGYNSRQASTQDGDTVFALAMQWDLHPDQFVQQYGDFEIQYKLSAESEWRPSFFVDGSLTKTDIVTASVNTEYDIRIRARNNLGVRSAWVYLYEAVVGYSGGVTDSLDWGSVADSPDFNLDWGAVDDPPDFYEDWGYVF